MLKKQQLDLLKKSNKTLAIIGKFRSEDDQIRYVFKNTGTKDGKISVADLFAKLKPELRSSSKGILPIGDTIFNKYELDTPLNAGDKGNSQPILFDSPLLDGTIYSGEEATGIQEQGKEVVKQLIESLDTVAYFTKSNFTKSLLKIAKHYLFLEANEHLEHKIAEDAQWYTTIYSERGLCSIIVQYLSAHEQDEPEIEIAFRKFLNDLKNNSGEKIYTEEQINQLAEALIRCKRVMLDGAEEDTTWSKIAKTSVFSWLKNYASDSDYGISHPQIGKKVGDRNFLAYYNVFMEASDKIHRLVRTQAIHSSIFCWLASKYTKWEVTSTEQAAQKMYEIGVENQGEKRIRGESREARSRNLELIQKAKIEETIANKIEGDENYQIFAEIAEDNIFVALLPDRAVTLKALRLRAKNLFKKLNQIASGKAGQLLKENDEFNQLFVKYYRSILNTETDAEITEFAERLNKEAAKDKDLEKFKNLDMKKLIEVVIKKAQEDEEDRTLKIKVKEAFISEFAQKSKNRFAEEYLKNQDQITREKQNAEDLYDLRSMIDVGFKQETAGGPVNVVTDLSMPDFDNIDQDIKIKRRENIRQETQTATNKSFNGQIVAAKPSIFESLPANTKSNVIDGEGQTIGSFTINKNNIELTVDNIEDSDKISSTEAKIEFDGKTYKIHDLDIPEIMDLPKSDEIKKAKKIAETAQNNFQQLSKSMDAILEKYQNEESSEPYFNRSFRSLLLCEYIQSAPKGATQIGREDLSNILGLMVDIVEHIGEVDNDKIFDGVLSKEPELLRLLQKINLSQYYPVEEGEEGKRQISTILQYHYELCKKLNNVKKYLQELEELKNFFAAMQRTDLEIVVINSTVGEYGDIYNIEDYETYSFNADYPAVVYLTSQSQADAGSLTKMADTLGELIDDYDNAKNLQIPIFVSPQTLPVDKIPLPLICPTEKFELPLLVFDPNETPGKDKLSITTDWQEQQNSYLLLSAATMLVDSSIAMGSVTKFLPPVSNKIRKDFDINIKKNQALVDLLRQFWLSSKCKLIDTLIFTKWLNVMILAKREDNKINIKEDFGQVLDEKLWNIREFPEVSQAAFATISPLANLPVKVEYNNQFSSPSSLGGGDFPMMETYGTSLEKAEKYIFEVPWKDLFAEYLERE
ncbi:MAG: hypothetical protein DSM107014_09820 [Gomphosphaeria aponina SAG 52.96 = DSM 107014]|uniref:Uncharacterized protein n=1 Tax=Gomphosphaeria aponina SAG 52.96 = DSM 107014 TaxID=1521640 RepID=A0A941JSB9_9CHRO|nr:hypothetical protein [Gomphosphaeria aponina SAG 52.96 = DSM 107014]